MEIGVIGVPGALVHRHVVQVHKVEQGHVTTPQKKEMVLIVQGAILRLKTVIQTFVQVGQYANVPKWMIIYLLKLTRIP